MPLIFFKQKDGLDIKQILIFLADGNGKLVRDHEASGVTHITNEEVLTTEVDVLIPAALENQINMDVASRIKAGIIVEGANGPTTVDADKILEAAGKRVVPDILANAGGVVVSYFEWIQNIQSASLSTMQTITTLLAARLSVRTSPVKSATCFAANMVKISLSYSCWVLAEM